MAETGLVRALLVEDDDRLADLTIEYLQGRDVVVTRESRGDTGLREAVRERYDVVLLDVMLPGLSGMEVCQQLRAKSDVPIIMITARGEEADRVMGLEIGADDYVPKPFSPRELLARIHSVVRRARGKAGPPARGGHEVGDLVIDGTSREVSVAGRAVELTAYEFDLLWALADAAGRVLGREQLMERARGNAEEAFDRSVDVHISRLRTKLGDTQRRRIKTVRGVGYQLAAIDGESQP